MTLEAILALLIHYRYLIIFPITVVEGPIIGVLVGFLVTQGIFDFWGAYLILIVANMVGDVMWYEFGHIGRHKFIRRWGYLIGVTDQLVTAMERRFKTASGRLLLLGKLAHGAGSIVIVAAGVAGVPFGEFFWYSLLGTLPKTLLFLGVGYYFGAAYHQINSGLTVAAIIIFSAIVLASLIWSRWHLGSKNQSI